MFFSRFLLLSSLLALGACSYAIDTSIQDITLKTPGARDAVCYVYVEKLRYRVYPPNTINIAKSDEDLVIDCLAPGNRRRKIYIKPRLEDSFAANVATGVFPGGVWDYASKAMYKYPSVIEISFVGMKSSPEPLPAQNNPDIKQPEEYLLEEFSPSSPRLNSDRNDPVVEIKHRNRAGQQGTSLGSGYTAAIPNSGEAEPTGGNKADLMDVIDGLGTDMNPAGAPNASGGAGNASDPIPLFPGE